MAAEQREVGLDRGDAGLTELRVHGVSGTPAASMLDHPAVLLKEVDGDRRAGFYRRWYPGGHTPDSQLGRIEAYSWGGLTSGPASRALWLLFLPFVLVSLAHWMLPPLAPDRRDASGRLAATLLRLIALTLTLTLLLATAVVALDLGAWQCAPVDRCANGFGPLGWLTGLEPGARLAVAALAPAALAAVLWRLGGQNLREMTPESPDPTPPGPAVDMAALPLASPTFWNGDVSELRLRAVHVATWSSALGALVLAPTVQAATTTIGRTVAAVLLVLHLAVLVGCVAVTCSERITGRGGSSRDRATRPLLRLRWGSLILLGAGLVAAALVPTSWTAHPTLPTHLPFLRGAVLGLFYAQLLLLLGLAAAVAVQQPWRIGRDRPGFAVALRGLAAPATAFTAWVVAVAFSVGIGLAAANALGSAVTSTAKAQLAASEAAAALADPGADLALRLDALQGPVALIVPPGYFWTGTAVVVMLAALLVVLLVVAVLVVRATRRESARVAESYGGVDPLSHAPSVARARVLAGITDHVDALLGPLLLVAVLIVVVGSGLYLLVDFDAVEGKIQWLTALGVGLTALAALGLVSLGFLAFRNARVRRYVGILWDVATFWPRANHPLTPPAYGERAVPDLVHRSRALTHGAADTVVITAHSQGSVLAAAVLMQRRGTQGSVRLVTYGAPLRRLYARFFPSYFGPLAFGAVSAATGERWVNLWATSDPIGAWVLSPRSDTVEGAVDVRVVEPVSLLPQPDGRFPATCGHSGYTGFVEFGEALRTVLR